MKKRWGYWVGLVAIAGGLFGVALAADEPLRVVAAENFYGGVAQEVLPDAKVTSILSNPNQDPHSFQTDAATAKEVAVMNDAEPSFAETAAFEKSLQTKEAKLLFYNSQVTDPSTERMQSIAKTNGVPVIGVTETQPPNADSYVDWMLDELNALGKALP